MACLLKNAKPQPRKTFLLPADHDVDPKVHIELLSQFLQFATFLAPTDSALSTPTLRHPDFSLATILLVPGSSRIASIIDWQDAFIFPLFMQAGYPAFCEHDYSQTQSLEIPKLPENFPTLSIEEQIQAKTKFRLDEANLYYTAATGVYNDEHMKALRLPYRSMRQYLIQQTGYPWDADVINLRAALVGITTPYVWHGISSSPCPLSFSDEERENAMAESSEWNESEALLSKVMQDLGIDCEGGTEPGNFEWAVQRNLQFRTEMVRQAEKDERETTWRNWPFKDDDGDSLPPCLDLWVSWRVFT